MQPTEEKVETTNSKRKLAEKQHKYLKYKNEKNQIRTVREAVQSDIIKNLSACQ